MPNVDMSEYPHLENAPIREALIDIQARLPKETTLDTLEEFGQLKSINKEFPNKKKRLSTKVNINLGSNEPKVQQSINAYGFISQDGNQVVQARMNGFTFSRLNRYKTWEHLWDESKKLWTLYRDTCKPEKITRVACRFINAITLPSSEKIEDYFTMLPPLIAGIPTTAEHFLTRIVIPIGNKPTKAIVTQLLEKATPQEKTIIIDIDVFRECSFDPDSDEFWDIIGTFREYKNIIFFNSVTEKTIEMCK